MNPSAIHIPKNLRFEQIQEPKLEANAKVGSLNNRTVALIILGSASILSVVAAVVSLVFASYIVAAVCATAFIAFALSTVIVSQIKVPQPIIIQENLERIVNLEVKNKRVKDQLNQLNQKLVLKENEIINLKNELDEAEKQRQHDVNYTQYTEREIKSLEMEILIQSFEKESGILLNACDEALRENLKKRNQARIEMWSFENKPAENFDNIEMKIQDRKKVMDLLKEIVASEKVFNDDMKELNTHLEKLEAENLLIKNDKEPSKWNIYIETQNLLVNLEILENDNAQLIDKVKDFQKAFSPQKMKKGYSKAIIEHILNSQSLIEKIKEINLTPRGQELNEEFLKNHNQVSLEDYIDKPLQRIHQIKPLMDQLNDQVESLEGDLPLFGDHCSYIQAFSELINVL